MFVIIKSIILHVIKIHNIFQMDSSLLFKQMTTFRQISTLRHVELCSLANSQFFKIWKQTILDSLEKNPSVQTTCPVKYFKLYNITSENPMHSLWPSGEYLNIIHISNDEDDMIFRFSYKSILKSIPNDNF